MKIQLNLKFIEILLNVIKISDDVKYEFYIYRLID